MPGFMSRQQKRRLYLLAHRPKPRTWPPPAHTDARLAAVAENARAAAVVYGEAMINDGHLICASRGYSEATRYEGLRDFYGGATEEGDDGE